MRDGKRQTNSERHIDSQRHIDSEAFPSPQVREGGHCPEVQQGNVAAWQLDKQMGKPIAATPAAVVYLHNSKYNENAVQLTLHRKVPRVEEDFKYMFHFLLTSGTAHREVWMKNWLLINLLTDIDPQADHHFQDGVRFDFDKSGAAYSKHVCQAGSNLCGHAEFGLSKVPCEQVILTKWLTDTQESTDMAALRTWMQRIGPDDIPEVRSSMNLVSEGFSGWFVDRVLQVRNNLIADTLSRNATFASLMKSLGDRAAQFGEPTEVLPVRMGFSSKTSISALVAEGAKAAEELHQNCSARAAAGECAATHDPISLLIACADVCVHANKLSNETLP